jgi:hypothetical protein
MIRFLLAIGLFADGLGEANNTDAVELLELPYAADGPTTILGGAPLDYFLSRYFATMAAQDSTKS